MPVNLLWMEYIINNQIQRADMLWNKYLIKCDFIKFKRLLQHAHENKQPECMKKAIEYLKTNNNVTKEALGNVYSRLLTYYTVNNEFENAKRTMENALADGLTTKQLTSTSLKSLKQLYEDNNQMFTYDIPVKEKKTN